MADNVSQQLLEMWKKQVEESSQAWVKMLGQGQAVDPQAFWRPFMDQGMAAWSKVMTQGQPSPDLMGQWKQFLDQWIAAWSKALEQAMGTDAFAKAMGKQLESVLNAANPVKKAAEQQIEATLAGLGVPSRSQVIALAKHVIQLEEKVDDIADRMESVAQLKSAIYGLEGRLDTILKRLTDLTATPKEERA
jgi:polyhydroxyalkanoate synthesis regulator phasin